MTFREPFISMSELRLRPAQAKILAYENGRLAISAVPGSGKTFTLSLLAAQLIGHGRINPDAGQQILIVTYLNASVDTFRARIRKRLDEMVRQRPRTRLGDNPVQGARGYAIR